MTGTFAEMAVAGLVLLATHFGVSSTRLRDRFVTALGEGPYLGLYSLVALVALVWLVVAYEAAPYRPLWLPGAVAYHVPVLVMPFALLLLVAGLSAPNPTAVGQSGLLETGEGARGVLRITRNPVMWGIGLWALAHLPPNGDLASLLFFGTLAVLALGGSVLIDRKNTRRRGVTWERFAAATSNLPLLAVLRGRQSLGAAVREIGWARLAGALALYVALLAVHPWLFGVSPLPPA